MAIFFLKNSVIELSPEQEEFGARLQDAYDVIAPQYTSREIPPLCLDNVILSVHQLGEWNDYGQCVLLNAALFHPDCIDVFKGVWAHEVCHAIANDAGHPGHSDLHAELCTRFQQELGVFVDANAESEDGGYDELSMFRVRMWAAKFAAKNCPRYLWIDTEDGDLADYCLLTEGQHKKAMSQRTYIDPYLNKEFVFGCKVEYKSLKKHLNIRKV